MSVVRCANDKIQSQSLSWSFEFDFEVLSASGAPVPVKKVRKLYGVMNF